MPREISLVPLVIQREDRSTMSHICERLVTATRYLEGQDMSVQQLRTLHHPQQKPETFTSTYKYFARNKDLRHANTLYAERLIFVAEKHRKGKGNIDLLIQQALTRWPL